MAAFYTALIVGTEAVGLAASYLTAKNHPAEKPLNQQDYHIVDSMVGQSPLRTTHHPAENVGFIPHKGPDDPFAVGAGGIGAAQLESINRQPRL